MWVSVLAPARLRPAAAPAPRPPPEQGAKAPWGLRQNDALDDVPALRFGAVDEAEIRFGDPAPVSAPTAAPAAA